MSMSRSPKNKNLNQCEYGCCGTLVRRGCHRTVTKQRLKRQVKRAERQRAKSEWLDKP